MFGKCLVSDCYYGLYTPSIGNIDEQTTKEHIAHVTEDVVESTKWQSIVDIPGVGTKRVVITYVLVTTDCQQLGRTEKESDDC